ncbi:MAG: hypothetical protein WCI73_17045 [Phycisphaerae bacterium]
MPSPPSSAIAAPKYGEKISVSTKGHEVEVPYLVTKATDRNDALNAILAAAPLTITSIEFFGYTPILYRLGVDADETPSPTTGLWEGTAHYSVQQVSGSPPRNTGDATFQFETGGNSMHITQALRHISSTPCAGTAQAPATKGCINVNGDGEAAGIDIETPVFNFSVTVCFARAAVSDAYLGWLYQLVGCVNNAPITIAVYGQAMTFAKGELKYKGASGGMRGGMDWEITFNLAASPNVKDVCANWDATVKPAAAIPKEGWQYAWVMYQPDVDTSAMVITRKPISVNVEQVYPYGNLSQLQLPAVTSPPPGP